MKYMDAFKPILITSLKNTAEYQVMNQPIIGAEDILLLLIIDILYLIRAEDILLLLNYLMRH